MSSALTDIYDLAKLAKELEQKLSSTEEVMYRIICGNVFFNRHRHQTPPRSYWFNKAVSCFS